MLGWDVAEFDKITPEQVQAAFDDAVKSGQDRERQKNEGQAYANDVIPKARGQAQQLLETASAYKQKKTNEALGDAAAAKRRWEFLLTAAPLPIVGGTGSPANPIATF